MRVDGLIQARMGSSRLPGKVMLPLAGRPLIWHIFDRLRRTVGVRAIVLATTRDARNDEMVAYATGLGMRVFRAELENDIAERLAGAVRMTDAQALLKVNGDCPLIDPDILGLIVERFMKNQSADYVSNKVVLRYPLGLSAEVISRRAMLWCDDSLRGAHEREYVADWIKEHPERFRVVSVEGDRNLSHHDWSVDTADGYAFVARIFDTLYRDSESFGLEDVLAYLAGAPKPKHPVMAESAS